MITIAIDASTKSTGIAVFDDKELKYYENFLENNKSVLKRIGYMTQSIESLYMDYSSEKVQVVMEQVIPDNLNDAKWTRNQATFKALFYLQAAIVLMFDHYGIEVELVGASTWRKWCGIKQGGANRETLKFRDTEFVRQNYKIEVNDDIADAICLGHGKLNHEPEPAAFNWT